MCIITDLYESEVEFSLILAFRSRDGEMKTLHYDDNSNYVGLSTFYNANSEVIEDYYGQIYTTDIRDLPREILGWVSWHLVSCNLRINGKEFAYADFNIEEGDSMPLSQALGWVKSCYKFIIKY